MGQLVYILLRKLRWSAPGLGDSDLWRGDRVALAGVITDGNLPSWQKTKN